MSRKPLITIGITCFNSEKTIIRALKSAFNQTWENKEIILVDDFSNDDSINLIKRFTRDFSNFKLIQHNKNYGYPYAINSILKNSLGEYIAIFDSDDKSKKERLKKQYERYSKYANENKTSNIICYSNRKVINSQKTNTSEIAYAIGRKKLEPKGEVVAEYILGIKIPTRKICYGVFGSCSMFLKKSTFKKIGYFDTSFRRFAEHDFSIRASFINCHFIAVNDTLITQYKIEKDYKSQKNIWKYSNLLINKYKNYLLSKGSYYSSKFLTYTRNFYFKKQKIRAYLCYIIALFLMPYDQKLLRIKKSKIINNLFNIKIN